MADTPETSFIPKQSMGSVPKRVAPKRSFSVFNFIATVIFLGTLLLALGVYFYQDYIEKSLDADKQTLAELKGSFDQSDIESLRELDLRINTASTLLDRHLSPSAIFDMLERRTQSDTQFRTFLYTRNESGSVALELQGEALRFNTVALQGQQLELESVLEQVIFSGLSVVSKVDEQQVTSEDRVTFLVSGLVDTALVGYATPVSADANTPNDIEAPQNPDIQEETVENDEEAEAETETEDTEASTDDNQSESSL